MLKIRYTFPQLTSAVGNGMNVLEKVTRDGTYQADGTSKGACSQGELFPVVGSSQDDSHSLRECVDSICASRTLNPDLGGVGVSWPPPHHRSLIMSAKVFVSLRYLCSWPLLLQSLLSL